MIVTKKSLNMENRFISIDDCENHDKEKEYNGLDTGVGLRIYQWVN